MGEIKTLTKLINKFIKERNWERFQKPKDLAISLSLEAAEVLEHFQWKGDKESKKHAKNNKEEVGDELADVAIYLFKLADKLKIDLPEAIKRKLVKSGKKYPAKLVKGDKRLKSYYKIKGKSRR